MKYRSNFDWLSKPRPVVVKVLLFPQPLDEIAKDAGRRRLQGLIVPPGQLTVGEWMRALRAVAGFWRRNWPHFAKKPLDRT